jgi:predicted nucleic acid-binding Zn ribbon protein
MAVYPCVCGCGWKHEVICPPAERATRLAAELCPVCGQQGFKRIYEAPAIAFKGPGFYHTDVKQVEDLQQARAKKLKEN